MITLRDFGSFHVGGRKVVVEGRAPRHIPVTRDVAIESDANGDFWVEQAYVQYFIPAAQHLALPLVLLHGGGLTGATFETTPDGRPGWLHRFLDAGVATYVVDSVERGRAGFCAIPDHWQGEPISRSAQEAWSLFRLGAPEDYAARRPFAGQRFPVDAFDRFARQFVPRWTTLRSAHLSAFEAAIDRVGPCFVLAHSQGGDAAFHVALHRPELVRGLIAIEPSGYPEEGLEAAPGQRFLFLFGDFIDRHPLGRELLERSLACHERLIAAGTRSELVRLPERGIHGNSHMMMMDRNSDQIADLIVAWLVAE